MLSNSISILAYRVINYPSESSHVYVMYVGKVKHSADEKTYPNFMVPETPGSYITEFRPEVQSSASL